MQRSRALSLYIAGVSQPSLHMNKSYPKPKRKTWYARELGLYKVVSPGNVCWLIYPVNCVVRYIPRNPSVTCPTDVHHWIVLPRSKEWRGNSSDQAENDRPPDVSTLHQPPTRWWIGWSSICAGGALSAAGTMKNMLESRQWNQPA